MLIGDGNFCQNCKGMTTGGCPSCNQKFYVVEDPPTVLPWTPPNPNGPIPTYQNPVLAYPTYPWPAPTYHVPEASQRERVFTALLAAILGRTPTMAINIDDLDQVMELTDKAIAKLNAV